MARMWTFQNSTRQHPPLRWWLVSWTSSLQPKSSFSSSWYAAGWISGIGTLAYVFLQQSSLSPSKDGDDDDDDKTTPWKKLSYPRFTTTPHEEELLNLLSSLTVPSYRRTNSMWNTTPTATTTTSCEFAAVPANDGGGDGPAFLNRQATMEWMDRTATGITLESKYDVQTRVLGVGAFGSVQQAVHRKTGQGVAVKRLPKTSTSHETVQRELQAMLKIQQAGGHPNLCGLHEHFDHGTEYALILDLVPGGELFDALLRNGPLPEADAARFLRQIASALMFLHDLGMVHADLKAENLMLSDPKPELAEIKIVDYGCTQHYSVQPPTRKGSWLFGGSNKNAATNNNNVPTITSPTNNPNKKESKQSSSSSSPSTTGNTEPDKGTGMAITPAYCPPEVLAELRKGTGIQSNNQGNTGGTANTIMIAPSFDMWSVGVVLFIMLTGAHPFDLKADATDEEIATRVLDCRLLTQTPKWQKHIAELSPEVQDLLKGLMDPNPTTRLTAADLLNSPWVRGLTASSQKVPDHRRAIYRKHQTKVAALFFKSMLQHSDTSSESIASHQTNLLDAAFSKLSGGSNNESSAQGSSSRQNNVRGFISSKDLGGDTSFFGVDARLNVAEAKELLSQTSGLNDQYYKSGHTIYREGDAGDVMYFIHSGTVRAESKDGYVKIKRAGEFFGEDVLNENTNSTQRSNSTKGGQDQPLYAFTAKTVTPVHAIEISRKDYEKFLQADEELAYTMKEQGRLRRREKARVLLGMERRIKHRDVVKGDLLFERGSIGDSLYSLLEGAVELSINGNTVRTLAPGDIAGEHAAFFGNKPYNVTAQCVSEQCKIGVLAGKDLRRALQKNPETKEAFYDIILRRDFKKGVVAYLKRPFPDTEAELRQAFDDLVEKSDCKDAIDMPVLRAMIKGFDPYYTEEQLVAMMNSLDLNGTKNMTWSEFKAAFSMNKYRPC